MSLKKILEKITYAVTVLVLCTLVYFAFQKYQENNFNDFVRSEANVYTSEFTRDATEKINSQKSYKITSEKYNDAMFYKEIKVEKNQPYKVTCMVKTNNVKSKEQQSGVGAQISIEGTTERSIAIQGTNDWQKIELIFNSKNRETVNIGFRLGGYLGQATGEAWFTDFKLEEGIEEKDNNWNFGCFIFKATDVNIGGKEVKFEVSPNDINDITNTIKRFESSAENLSEGKMTAKCDIHEIDVPITELSYDNEFGYYVSPENVETQIKDIVKQNNYDHIFVIMRLGDANHENDIEVNDWIGLGAMDYYGIGFSNIRLPNDSKSYIYKYNTRINTFPEEVFLHEFLHSLERNSKEYGYEVPALHDYEKYGYKNEKLEGQKKWYTDYMNKNIKYNGQNIGLSEDIYTLKPAKNNNFEYPYQIDEFNQPENVIEELKEIINKMKKAI